VSGKSGVGKKWCRENIAEIAKFGHFAKYSVCKSLFWEIIVYNRINFEQKLPAFRACSAGKDRTATLALHSGHVSVIEYVPIQSMHL
jgi:hypothetical protein